MDGEILVRAAAAARASSAAPKPRLQPLAAFVEAARAACFASPAWTAGPRSSDPPRLAEAPVAALAFDLAGRRLTVDHDGDP